MCAVFGLNFTLKYDINCVVWLNFIPVLVLPDSLAKSKHEDCEKPPEVENASVVVSFDKNEEFVTATYRCHEGFKLKGKSEITCDLDTDEWEEMPPSCDKGKMKTVYFMWLF